MFKAKCKCIGCEHLEDGIYYQKNECYNRVILHITQAITNAEETKDMELYSWLKELHRNIKIFHKYYNQKETDSHSEK